MKEVLFFIFCINILRFILIQKITHCKELGTLRVVSLKIVIWTWNLCREIGLNLQLIHSSNLQTTSYAIIHIHAQEETEIERC